MLQIVDLKLKAFVAEDRIEHEPVDELSFCLRGKRSTDLLLIGLLLEHEIHERLALLSKLHLEAFEHIGGHRVDHLR